MPAQHALDIYRGDTGHWSFTLWLDDAHTQPYDLSGATAAAEVRAKANGPVLASLVCTISLPNSVAVDLPAATSGGLSGKAVWDLQLTWPDGRVRTVVAGAVTVTEDVTDSTRP